VRKIEVLEVLLFSFIEHAEDVTLIEKMQKEMSVIATMPTDYRN